MCWVRPLERLEEPPLGPHKFFPREDSANLSMSDLSLSLYLCIYIYTCDIKICTGSLYFFYPFVMS